MDDTKVLEGYVRYLRNRGYAERTVESYVWVAAYFLRNYGEASAQNVVAYREWLASTFKPTTANQRVQAINCFLGYLGHDDLKQRVLRVQYRTFLSKTIDGDAFRRLSGHLLEGGYLRDYHAVRIMATTGVRVSELLGMEVGHMRDGYLDVKSKGKIRRVQIPDATVCDVLRWVEEEGRTEGPLFLNRNGLPITKRGFAHQLKVRAEECGVDSSVVHPHAFRHYFARRFLAAGGDIALLADLLGHSSVETTRVYLRRTADEQRDVLNRLVTW